MNGILEVMGVALTALLAENFMLVTTMGMSTREEAFQRPRESVRTGLCLTVIMMLSTVVAWCLDVWVLTRYGLTYYRAFLFALLVPALVWMLRSFLRLCVPELYRRMNAPLSEITTNCAAMGCALLVAIRSYGFLESLAFALFGGLGVTLVLANYAHLMGEADLDHCPRSFQGMPIQLITMGLMAMSLVGFYGLHIQVR